MALDILTQNIIIDETTGLQDDDVNSAVAPHNNATVQYLLGLDASGGLSSPQLAFQANFVQATASAGEAIASIVLTQNASGTPFSTTSGVNSGIRTIDGDYVWLFQDATHANVVIGVIGTSDPLVEPAETGPLAYSLALISSSNTNADLYAVQYVPLLQPDASDPDDRIDLADHVFASVSGSTTVSFSGQNAAPGNNDFYVINSPSDSSKQILVTGFLGANNAQANVSTQGFGVNNQSINPTERLQIDFVTGGALPAGSASQIQYGSHIETITQAGFTINQITPSNPNLRVDITIGALNVQGNEQGLNFWDGSATTAAPITAIKLTGQSGLVNTITANGTYDVAGNVDIVVTGMGTGAVTIRGLDNVTTVDVTTSSPMDRLTVTGVDTNEGLDITEFHFSAQTPNAHTEEVGSSINFDDDGPSIAANATAVPTLTTDDTNIPESAGPTSFAGLFTSAFGQDGFKDTNDNNVQDTDAITYALGVKNGGSNLASGLTDTLSGDAVVLNEVGGDIVGTVTGTALEVFRISVSATGAVTFTQSRSVVHDNPLDPEETGASAAGLAADLVTLTATITDGDLDTASATRNIGGAFKIEDDGPSIAVNAATVPTLTNDDTNIPESAGPTSFVGLFTSAFGKDGFKDVDDNNAQDTDAITYALGVKNGGSNLASGLTDTLSGDAVVLNEVGGDIVGTVTGTALEVFRISVSATGAVTFTQSRSVVHDNPLDPEETGASAAGLAADLVTLTATITDGDRDTASATRNIGDAFKIEDDGPTLTAPFDADPNTAGVQTPEQLGNAVGQTASGVFGYAIGADAHSAAFYTGGGSDFVDTNNGLAGVQIALTGTVDNDQNPSITNAVATLASESLTTATFNFSFQYDKDPITAGVQSASAGGTLVFNKATDTYAFTLSDVIDGFSFEVLQTSELVAKQPTGNTGHPLIVAEQLTPNSDPDPFFVQFTANSINQQSGFGFNSTGDGAASGTPADVAFTQGDHDLVTNTNEDWVSATQSTNGVAGDTIQKGELLTLRFFEENILGDVNPGATGGGSERLDPTTSASGVVIKFDGVGTSEDLVVILDLKDASGDEITRAVNVQNSDLIKGNANVPSPYNAEFTLDNNDALLIIEQNDYTMGGETYQIQGVQIMQSGNGLTGQAINLNRATGDNGGSNATTNLTAWDLTDNDVLKIVDIGFVQQNSGTIGAYLDFAFDVADGDQDLLGVQHINVQIDDMYIL